jgi:hypothetical protein
VFRRERKAVEKAFLEETRRASGIYMVTCSTLPASRRREKKVKLYLPTRLTLSKKTHTKRIKIDRLHYRIKYLEALPLDESFFATLEFIKKLARIR